jgi:hypothetical protein
LTADPRAERSRDTGEPPIQVAPFVQRHAAVLIPLVPIVIVVLRIARVSNFDATTARGVLESSGLVQVIAGTLLPLVPTALFLGALALSVYAFRERTPLARMSRVLAPPVAIFCVVLFPWGILVLLVAGALVVLAIEWQLARRRSRRVFGSIDSNWLLGAGALLVLAQIFIYGTMWLPAERVETRQGATTVGYVIESDFVWTSVLLEESRSIRRFRTESVRSRTVCQVEESDIDGESSLVDLLTDRRRPKYPEC